MGDIITPVVGENSHSNSELILSVQYYSTHLSPFGDCHGFSHCGLFASLALAPLTSASWALTVAQITVEVDEKSKEQSPKK